MNQKVIFILTAILLLIAACDKEDNPIQVNDIDVFKSQLLGSWITVDSSKIIFYQNNTFVDSSRIDPTSIMVVTGRYSISNDILSYYDLASVFIDTANLSPSYVAILRYFYSSKIQFSNDTLLLKATEVFSQVQGNGIPMEGIWESKRWIAGYDRRSSPTLVQGTINSYFKFSPDSSEYEMTEIRSYGSILNNSTSSGKYVYTPPYLEILGYGNILVEIVDGKMLWTYSWSPRRYSKNS